MATASWCWISTNVRWNRKALSRLSSVIRVMRLPSSPKNSMQSLFDGFHGFCRDWYEWNDCISGGGVFSYLLPCRMLVMSAAGTTVPSCRWLWHPTWSIYRSSTKVTPSGRLPSVISRPDGSLTVGMSSFERASQTRGRLDCDVAPTDHCIMLPHGSRCSLFASTDAPLCTALWCRSQMLHSLLTTTLSGRSRPSVCLFVCLSVCQFVCLSAA